MSVRAYAEYRDTGGEWLPRVPAHWRTASLRWLSRRFSGGTPDKNTQEYWTDGSIPWLNSGAVNQTLITEPSTFISESGFSNSSAKWIPEGALVMALAGQGKTKGMVAQLAIPSTCNQSMAAIVPSAEIQARFLLWWLQSNYQNIRNMAGGDLRDGLNLDLLGDIPCPLPSSSEQFCIAAFLDRQTAKIDALVEEQRRLIELLKEKRQAVISQAVTKGLDPNVLMTDSGVQWLGNVPAGWAVKRIKFLVADGEGIQMGPFGGMLLDLSAEDTGFKVYGQENTISGDFSRGNRWISKERYTNLDGYHIGTGDLLLTRKGSLGNARLVHSLPEPGIMDSDTIRVRVNESLILPKLLAFLLHEAQYVAEQIEISKRGAILPGLNSETISNISIVLPPLDCQRRLVQLLAGR